MFVAKPYNSRLSASAPLSHNSQHKPFYNSAPKRQSIFCARTNASRHSVREPGSPSVGCKCCEHSKPRVARARSQRLVRSLRKVRSQRLACDLFTRKISQLLHSFQIVSLWLFLSTALVSCDPDSSSSSAPPPRFTLTPNDDGITLTLAEGVKTIAKGEFSASEDIEDRRSASRITVPTRLKLGANPDNAVTAIVLPSTLTTIEDFAFFNHRKVRGKITIPKRVQKIGAESFVSLGADSFSTPMTIEFEESSQLVAIGERAFEFARANNVLKLPESLETIGDRAFANLAGTTATSSFTIPGKVKNIGKYLFIPYSGTANITGTLTIASPYLRKANLGINLFMYANRRGGGFHPSNFTTIQLHKAVYDSYTNAELNAIFGAGATYQSLDGIDHPPK